MRLGLIGLGRIGAFHAETLASLPVVDSLVVTDIIPDLTTEVAERLGGGAGRLAGRAAARRAWTASSSPPATDAHPELILAAVEAGLPVFCEKPVARTIAEGAEVVARVRRLGRPRADRLPAALRRRLRRPRTTPSPPASWAGCTPSAPPPSTRRPRRPQYVAVSGGIFRDCGVHDFDIIRWVTGREVVEVYATGSNQGDDFFADAGDVDTAAAVLTLDDGTLAVVSNTRYNPRGYDVRLEVHGSSGQHRRRPGEEAAAALGRAAGARSRTGAPHRLFMDRFLAAYQRRAGGVRRARGRGPAQPRCTVEDGARGRPGSPRPAACPCASTVRCGSMRCDP